MFNSCQMLTPEQRQILFLSVFGVFLLKWIELLAKH